MDSAGLRSSSTRSPGGLGVVEQKTVTFNEPQLLQSGQTIASVTVVYETYGELNQAKDNAVLVLHALSGDAHAAGLAGDGKSVGWWDPMIGPGKAFDTNKYFVICSNVLGGCRGTTGPGSIDPRTGKPYGLRFPIITIADMVETQRRLVDHLGIGRLLAVVGGSMGGMQALQWAASYPERVRCCIPIATTMKHSPQQIALDEVGRRAIMSDPAWRGGDYYGHGQPERGLALARMIGHITHMSDLSMEEKFSRRLKNNAEAYSISFEPEFEVEGYLQHRGTSFVRRFDANSYLYVTKAMDYFNLSEGKLLPKEATTMPEYLVIAFKSDWLYPIQQAREIVTELRARHAKLTYCEISSTYGHDAFLVEFNEETRLVAGVLGRVHAGK